MEEARVEQLYEWMDKTTTDIQQYTDETYVESLTRALELLFFQHVEEEENEIFAKRLQEALKEVQKFSFTKDTIRSSSQLAILKGMKDHTQQQHEMTPETIALFIGYLADQLMKRRKHVRLFDPACGTGTLLTGVMKQLTQEVTAYASEIDPTLIHLAVVNANLQQYEVEFFHQDSLRPFLLDPVDIVAIDLPVGYYPDDVHAANFELAANEGHAYAHHLFLEQSLTYTSPGGYVIAVIPQFLFESDQSDQLHAFMKKHAHIIGVLELPKTAFKSEQSRKSIFILEKKGTHTTGVQQPLLVQMPSFKEVQAMEQMIVQIGEWFQTHIHSKEGK
ncbi:MAG TPA: class I SAM-dependent methyltransferase [Virgibacillus sp.]|nr:class I SAM-dependent methyltransferase [Virgibacillus sp.]